MLIRYQVPIFDTLLPCPTPLVVCQRAKQFHRRGKLSAVDVGAALFDPNRATDLTNTVSGLIKGKYAELRVRNTVVDFQKVLSCFRIAPTH